MRYDTDGFINRLPGNRWACHAAIASPYSDASRFSSSKLAPHERAAIKSFFFCRAIAASSSFVISYLLTKVYQTLASVSIGNMFVHQTLSNNGKP